MPKTFYTERDILDLYDRGVRVIDVDDEVVLTDLAHDKALALGMRLARNSAASQTQTPASPDEIAARVKAAVIARLGKDVDTALLDSVIARVVAQIK